MRAFILSLLCMIMCGCNSIYLKPGTLDTKSTIYTPRGGYSMQRSIKQVMDERGYKTHVGRLKIEKQSEDFAVQTFEIPNNVR